MATLNLGRVRINFKGNFDDFDGQTLLFYDAVTFAGSLYVVKVSSVTVDTDPTTGNAPTSTSGQTSFLKITDGVEYKGTWQPNTNYFKNQILYHQGTTYIAIKDIPSNRNTPQNEINANTGHYQYIAAGFGNFVANYDGATALNQTDIVSFNSTLWIAVTDVLASENPENTPQKFEILAPGYNQKSSWSSGTTYYFRDVVNFHGNAFVVINDAGTTNQPINGTTGLLDPDWQILTKGFEWAGTYSETSADGYYPGDVFSFNGAVFLTTIRAAVGEDPADTPAKFTQLLGAGSYELGDLLNVDTTNSIEGSILQYDANSSTWIASEIITSETF